MHTRAFPMRAASVLLAGVAVFSCFPTDASASGQVKLTPSDDPAPPGNFGQSVSISGDTVIVGRPHDDDLGVLRGSAYIYKWNGSVWMEEAKLTDPGGEFEDYFGRFVAINGDTAVVGRVPDSEEEPRPGAVHVFTRSGSTWTEQSILTTSDGIEEDWFGYSIAISGESVLVGSSILGKAYVFTRSGSSWTEEAILDVGSFRTTVALDGDTAIVGTPLDDHAGLRSGAAHVFTRSASAWTLQQKLTAPDAAAEDRFGQSVALFGDVVLVGASGDSDDGSNSGSVRVFTRSGTTWTQQERLSASDAAAGDQFGGAVALEPDIALIGATGDDDGAAISTGSAYVFRRSGSNWMEQAKMTAFDSAGANYEQFGISVSLSGDRAIVGTLVGEGAYVVTLCAADLSGDGFVDGADLADLLSQWGGPGAADSDANGVVDGADLAALLAAWGACP